MWNVAAGAFLGGLMGGPIGAMAGAALAAGVSGADGSAAAGLPHLDAELRWEADEDGVYFEVEPRGVPAGSACLVAAVDHDHGWLRSADPDFGDPDGDVSRTGPLEPDGCFRTFIPWGIVDHRGTVSLLVRMFRLDDQGNAAWARECVFKLGANSLVWRHRSWKRCHAWRPLIGLCMAVARADGRLDRSEIREIRTLLADGLDIPDAERDDIKVVLKQEPSQPVAAMVEDLYRRFPALDPLAVLSALADVARADGTVDRAELDIIHEVAGLLGADEDGWRAIAGELGLTTSDRRGEWSDLLGVSPGAPARVIRRAHREKISQYHPDKYATLPDEFRQVALDMTRRLNEARDGLLAASGNGSA